MTYKVSRSTEAAVPSEDALLALRELGLGECEARFMLAVGRGETDGDVIEVDVLPVVPVAALLQRPDDPPERPDAAKGAPENGAFRAPRPKGPSKIMAGR